METTRKKTNSLPPKYFLSPLEKGDRLTRGILYCRYEAMPENVKRTKIVFSD